MIDVKSEKVLPLKHDMLALLRECMSVQVNKHSGNIIEIKVNWTINNKVYQICSTEREL
jgi:hypothetical protein